MNEYKSLKDAAEQIETGFMGSFLAPSLDNANEYNVDRHDIYRNDENGLIVFRRYSSKALNLTEFRAARETIDEFMKGMK